MSGPTLEIGPPMLTAVVPHNRAWRGSSLAAEQYLTKMPDECWRELDAVLGELRAGPVPMLLLLPEHFHLDACVRWMSTVRDRLHDGPGFVVLDRLPLDRMTRQEAIDLYWILANLLAPPVAQEWKGTMIYDVRHDGQSFTADTRGALTPVGLEMHTDSSMGEAPPSYITLLCLQTARAGGMSSLASALAVHNHFLQARPDLLRRLYEPFYRDHQQYQSAGAAETNFRPVFAWDGQLRTRFNARHIFRGYEKTGRVLDDAGAAAVRLMDEFLTDEQNRLDLWLEPGQIQILNNRVIVHGRTPYEDYEEPERRRHLVRLWLRAGDRRHFRG